ncbi:MAG: hypothetical protein DMG87_16995 [Acidobacteria bacterium]|nr:MAG: hypothetical protein DMG87_16995 [Acidobacteriota bacterium]
MLTTIMKYVAIATLLVGMFWWRIPANLRTYLDFAITAGAVFVLVQALNLRKYWWVAGFVGITCLFNPIQPIGFSFETLVALQVMSAALFAVSLQLLRTSPRMTIASITEANPRTESL